MMITEPKLPPKAGYVEIEDDGGNRLYRKVETPDAGRITALETENTALQSTIDQLTVAVLEG